MGIHVHLCRNQSGVQCLSLDSVVLSLGLGACGTATPWENPALGRQVDASLQATHLLDARGTGCWEMASCNPPTPHHHPCPCLKGSEITEEIVIDSTFLKKKKKKANFCFPLSQPRPIPAPQIGSWRANLMGPQFYATPCPSWGLEM